MSARTRRVLTTQWLGEAWKEYQVEHQQVLWSSFLKTGCLVTANGHGDSDIKPQGMPGFTFKRMDASKIVYDKRLINKACFVNLDDAQAVPVAGDGQDAHDDFTHKLGHNMDSDEWFLSSEAPPPEPEPEPEPGAAGRSKMRKSFKRNAPAKRKERATATGAPRKHPKGSKRPATGGTAGSRRGGKGRASKAPKASGPASEEEEEKGSESEALEYAQELQGRRKKSVVAKAKQVHAAQKRGDPLPEISSEEEEDWVPGNSPQGKKKKKTKRDEVWAAVVEMRLADERRKRDEDEAREKKASRKGGIGEAGSVKAPNKAGASKKAGAVKATWDKAGLAKHAEVLTTADWAKYQVFTLYGDGLTYYGNPDPQDPYAKKYDNHWRMVVK
eukprot:jgi/Mesvir1/24096/Mv10818-RA.1